MVALNLFNNVAASRGYAHTSSLSQVTMNRDEMSMATRGMTFTQPDYLPDGVNQISGGAFGGILNLIGKYNDEGLPPESTKMWIG